MPRRAVPGACRAPIAGPTAASSDAAEHVMAQEASAPCEGGAGRITPDAVIERDLTGNGRADPILARDGVACAGGGRSNACGAQACLVRIRVRRSRPPALEEQFGRTGVTVDDGCAPGVRVSGNGGNARSIRRDARAFRPGMRRAAGSARPS